MPNSELYADKPFVFAGNGTTSLHFDIGSIQSKMRDDSPNRLVLGYTRTMMGFLLFNGAPEHVAMIGLGGGSIPKYCHHHLPDCRISVVEINPDVIALRDNFHVPADSERFAIHCADGADYVRRHHEVFDVLVVDGFDESGQVRQLCTQAFYDSCYKSLCHEGVMAVNLSGNDHRVDAYLARMRSSFNNAVVIVKAEGSTNRIAFAIKGPALRQSASRFTAKATYLEARHPLQFRYIVQQFKALA